MRGPSPAEYALLRSLLAGPRQVLDGPLGQCAKRGWCALVEGTRTARKPALYALTEAGLALLAEPATP